MNSHTYVLLQNTTKSSVFNKLSKDFINMLLTCVYIYMTSQGILTTLKLLDFHNFPSFDFPPLKWKTRNGTPNNRKTLGLH